MNSSLRNEIFSLMRKEFLTELRSPSGIMTSGLFGLVSVVGISLTTYNVTVEPTVAAGLLWVVLLFAGVIAMPRSFLIEEEQGTGDMLRLLGDASTVYWGKGLYNLFLMQSLGVVLSLIFIVMTGRAVIFPHLFVVSLIGGCGAIAGAVTLCSALVSRAANAVALSAAVAIPMLLFLVMLGTSGFRAAFGADTGGLGLMISFSLVAYAIGTYAIGSTIFPAVWKK